MKKSFIYTCTGDAGTTSLVGGKRVKKNDCRIESYGSVDELNSVLGLLASMPDITAEHRSLLTFIQNKLFNRVCYFRIIFTGIYRFFLNMLHGDCHRRITFKWDLACEHFIQNNAERIERALLALKRFFTDTRTY